MSAAAGSRSVARMMLPLAAAAAPQPFDVYDALAYIVGLLVAAVVIGVVFHAWRLYKARVAEQEAMEEAAERAFERSLLGEVAAAPEASAEAPPSPDGAPAAAKSPDAPRAAPAPVAFPYAPVAPQDPATSPEQARLDALVHRLRATRVLTDREGQISLGLPPDAPIFRLRRGGLAVVLPRLESEAMMANLTSRFDLVFVAAGEGRSIVCERLDNRLVDLMDQEGLLPSPGRG